MAIDGETHAASEADATPYAAPDAASDTAD